MYPWLQCTLILITVFNHLSCPHVLLLSSQVARLQLSILDAMKALRRPPLSDVARAIPSLNSELMDITQLYEHFAEKFGLAECKLAIVHCAGHHNPALVESLWRDIVDTGEWNGSGCLGYLVAACSDSIWSKFFVNVRNGGG